MQELDILKIVLERLNNAEIEYMLTGSMALSYYVQPRMTRDIDIVISITEKDVAKIYNLFKEDFYIDKESISDSIKEQSSFNIIYFDFPMKFDFIVRKDTPSEIQLNDLRLLLAKEKIDLKYIKEKAEVLSVTTLLKELS